MGDASEPMEVYVQQGNTALLESMLLTWLATRPSTVDAPPGVPVSEAVRSLASSMGSDHVEARASLQRCLASLAARGLALGTPPQRKNASPRWRISDAGKKAALAALGYADWPERQKIDWRRARKVLLSRALGQSLPGAWKHAGKAPWLAAWFLARRYDLPRAGEATPDQVLTLLATRAGFETAMPLTLNHAFSWALRNSAQALAGPFDPEDFAHRVLRAAAAAPTGRWLDDRVFIAHVWKELQRDGSYLEMTFADFQAHLVAAHKAKRLRLVRGDLIAALPRDDVRASETDDGEATFHFVKLDRAAAQGG